MLAVLAQTIKGLIEVVDGWNKCRTFTQEADVCVPCVPKSQYWTILMYSHEVTSHNTVMSAHLLTHSLFLNLNKEYFMPKPIPLWTVPMKVTWQTYLTLSLPAHLKLADDMTLSSTFFFPAALRGYVIVTSGNNSNSPFPSPHINL